MRSRTAIFPRIPLTETVFSVLLLSGSKRFCVWSDGFMIRRRAIPAVVLGVLALGATVRADMMPLSPSDAGYQQPLRAWAAADQPGMNPSGPFDCPGITDLSLPPVTSLPRAGSDIGETCERQPVQILTEGQDSFSLCLCALLSLGVCKSVPLVKKFSFGYIPQWYHDGGPAQVGHSLAISPDCLCSAPVCCFVQPDRIAENPIPRYHFPTVVALWRNSQFTPAALASRAPPFHSC